MYFKPKWLKNHNPFGADIAHIRECLPLPFSSQLLNYSSIIYFIENIQ